MKRKKIESAGAKLDSKTALLEVAEYFEKLLPELRAEHIDEEKPLPTSFKAFLN